MLISIKMNLLQKIEQEHITQLTTEHKVPDFKAGDTLLITISRTKEIKSTKKGKQPEFKTYQERTEGLCISRTSKGLGSSFKVRTIINNMSFVTMYPLFGTQIEVKDKGMMRQAKPYYLLNLYGKKAKVESIRDYRSRKKIARA